MLNIQGHVAVLVLFCSQSCPNATATQLYPDVGQAEHNPRQDPARRITLRLDLPHARRGWSCLQAVIVSELLISGVSDCCIVAVSGAEGLDCLLFVYMKSIHLTCAGANVAQGDINFRRYRSDGGWPRAK